VPPLEPNPETSGTVWVECPYPLMALGLNQTLETAGFVVRHGQKGPAAKKETAPSCVVFCCPNGEGVTQQVTRLRVLFPDVPVLVLGLSGSDLSLARAALQAGARGYLHFGMQPSQIVRAISLASKGEVVVPRELVKGLVIGEEPPNVPALTGRQREVLELVAQGLTNADIARRLFLSEDTVKQHLRVAYKLLGVKSRTQAITLLRRHNPPGATTEQ
jgi:DNA-binding NarL/FixJ family response regulator